MAMTLLHLPRRYMCTLYRLMAMVCIRYRTPHATKIGKKSRVPSVKSYACKIIKCRAKIFESHFNRIGGHSKIERIAYENQWPT